jgi:hypothetical protein
VNETVYQPKAAQNLYGMRPAGSSTLFPKGVPMTAYPLTSTRTTALPKGRCFKRTSAMAGANSGGIPGTAKHAGGGLPHFSG